jgi:hypothetical protein
MIVDKYENMATLYEKLCAICVGGLELRSV